MKFNLKTSVVFSKDFEIEAEHLDDAMKMVQSMIEENVYLDGYELTRIGFNMDDPSIREYNIKMCKEKIARQCGTQQS